MPKYIAIVNQKGGVGKTSTGVNLCGAFHSRGSSVLAVDADPQKSLTDWMQTSDPPCFPFSVLEMCHSNIHRKLPEIAEAASYDWVVVDCPPGGQGHTQQDNISRSAIIIADVVLVPLLPAILDFYAANRLRKLLMEVSMLRQDLKITVVINRRKPSGRLSKSARAVAAAYLKEEGINLSVLETEIYERSVIAESVAYGKTVLDYTPNSKSSREAVAKATAEYLALSKEIEACLKPAPLNA